MSHLEPIPFAADRDSDETATVASVLRSADTSPREIDSADAPIDSAARVEFAMDYICEALQAQGQAINAVADQLSRMNVSAKTVGPPATDQSVELESQLNGAEDEEPSLPTSAGLGDSWSQMKLAVLEAHNCSGGFADLNNVVDSPGENSHVKPDLCADSDDVGPEELKVAELESVLARIPALASVGDLTDDQLRKAVADRDQVIRMLTAQLRRPSVVTLTTEQLKHFADSAPDVLRQRIEDSLQSLDRQVRLGELELSLERARIARQVTTLQATRQKLQKAAQAFGMTLNEDGTLEGEVQTPQKGSRGRRWLGVLGFGN